MLKTKKSHELNVIVEKICECVVVVDVGVGVVGRRKYFDSLTCVCMDVFVSVRGCVCV